MDYESLLDALEEHTLATIQVKENEGNPDTYAGLYDREGAADRLLFARFCLSEELKKLT